ncbi:hypothetical protein A2U01_0110090, partial [Trifolium medium]|nr:hypothetical protein [Trifolium medium]
FLCDSGSLHGCQFWISVVPFIRGSGSGVVVSSGGVGCDLATQWVFSGGAVVVFWRGSEVWWWRLEVL